MKRNRIYLKDWLALKPYEDHTITDNYYLNLCNELRELFLNSFIDILVEYLEMDEIDELSCLLVSYFEDVISETNIWNTFVELHEKMYGKKLPFFDIQEDQYVQNEVNIEDIQFLLWYFINTIQEDTYVHPINEMIPEIASSVFEIFDKEYEYAPENLVLKRQYMIDESETDFYIARNLIEKLLFNTYLFYPDTNRELIISTLEIMENNKNDENLIHFMNENKDSKVFDSHTKLLGLKGNEWVANMIGENHKLSKDFSTISQKIHGLFLYKNHNETDIVIEHIASGKEFNLTKKSFDHYDELIKDDSILYMGIVNWKNEWWFSGIYTKLDFNADIILDEKNSIASRMAVSFLDQNSAEIKEIQMKQYNMFKEFNNGSLIAFMPSNKIQEFIENHTEFYNKSLDLSIKEHEETKTRSAKDGFFPDEEQADMGFSDYEDLGLVFFNPKSGIEVAFYVNSAFPLEHNPFYQEDESVEALQRLMMSEDYSTELVNFCLEQCKDKLPFIKNMIWISILENLDFLLRFWKGKDYHSKTLITTVGKN